MSLIKVHFGKTIIPAAYIWWHGESLLIISPWGWEASVFYFSFFWGAVPSPWLQGIANNHSQIERKKCATLFFFFLFSSYAFPWSTGLHIMHENEITPCDQRWRQLLHKTWNCLNMIPTLNFTPTLTGTWLCTFTFTIWILSPDPYGDPGGSGILYRTVELPSISSTQAAVLAVQLITAAWQLFCKTNYIYYSRESPSANQRSVK